VSPDVGEKHEAGDPGNGGDSGQCFDDGSIRLSCSSFSTRKDSRNASAEEIALPSEPEGSEGEHREEEASDGEDRGHSPVEAGLAPVNTCVN